MVEARTHRNQALVLAEAESRGISCTQFQSIARLQLGDHVEYFHYQISARTTVVAARICIDKEVTRSVLADAGLAVTDGQAFERSQFDRGLAYARDELGWPVVIKPTTGGLGRGVFVDVTSDAYFGRAWSESSRTKRRLLVERMYEGTECRFLVIDGTTVGVTRRIPANVVGDGSSTVRELVQRKNTDPARVSNPALKSIELDVAARETLRSVGLGFTSVPEAGQLVHLRRSSNLSTGGDSVDMTDDVHPSFKEIAAAACGAIPGLGYGGVDIMAADFTRDPRGTGGSAPGYVVIEVNSQPMITMHHFPQVGTPRDAAGAIVDFLFPETAAGSPRRAQTGGGRTGGVRDGAGSRRTSLLRLGRRSLP